MGFLDETGLELLWANIMNLVNSKISTIEVPVTKVNGKTGEVVLTAADIGATTESYVDSKIASMVDSAPETLNTLNELAAALGDDPNFATTIANQIGNKVDKTTTVNGKALSSNITLTASDVGALPSSTVIPSTAGLASQTYVNQAVAKKMDKNDPVGTGSFSLNRKTGTTVGIYSFTEGDNNTASGQYAHAEGYSTTASGNRSHAEGTGTEASGLLSHAEGSHTKALGERSHAEGNNSIASGYIAHAEGGQTKASGRFSHAEGFSTEASGDNSHAEGSGTEASGLMSHAEGDNTRAFSYRSHAEGEYTIAAGASSHAEGYNSRMSSGITITGEAGVTIYQYTGTPVAELTVGARLFCPSTYASSKVTAIDTSNLTISVQNTLSSSSALSNSEVNFYRANTKGDGSHSEGHNTMAHGDASHAEGEETQAYGSYSHAEGQNTYASGRSQHVQGRYNLISDGYAHIVGNGDSENRSNAMTLDWQGNARFDGDIYVQGTGTSNLTDAKKVATEEFVTSKGYLTSVPAEYITETELTAKDYVTEAYVDTAVSNKMNKVDPTGTGSFSLNRKADTSIGYRSFAEGNNTTASGAYSHAEGGDTTASGGFSHAEGNNTTASGAYSHAEGSDTTAFGNYSHAEGGYTTASGGYSHAEGGYTTALGNSSHAEGSETIASGINSHAEGTGAIAKGSGSHAENNGKAYGEYSHAEGKGFTTGKYGHAEGSFSGTSHSGIKLTGEINATTYTYTGTPTSIVVIGNRVRIINGDYYAQIIDIDTINNTITVDQTLTPLQAASESSVSIERSRASGYSSHAEGEDTIASGDYSHAEGKSSEAPGLTGHAEGYSTIASGAYSHSEGDHTKAYGWGSHTGGLYTEAHEAYSTVIGKYNYTNGSTYYYSSSETKTYVYYYFNTQYQIFTGTPTQNLSTGTFIYPELTTVTGADIVEGTQIYVNDSTFYVVTAQEQTSSSWSRWTVTVHRIKSSTEDIGTYALMVGNGTEVNARSNAHTLDWDGNAWYQTSVCIGGENQNAAQTSLAVNGLILTDETTGVKYRLFINNGSIATEVLE